MAAGAALWVECPLRPEQRADWQLDGVAPPQDATPAGETPAAGAHGGLTARLHVAAARARHAGVWTCAPGGGGVRVRVVLLPASSSSSSAAAAAAPRPGTRRGAESYRYLIFTCL